MSTRSSVAPRFRRSLTLLRHGGRRVTDTPTERAAESTWTRLRRRKVVQWGIAYVAAAWALLQGIDFLADAFQWPDAVKQIATLVLLIGLPVALVLAWFHGDRGEQRAGAPVLLESRTSLVVARVPPDGQLAMDSSRVPSQ